MGENLPLDCHRRVLNSLIRERAGIQAVSAGLAHFSTVFLTDSKVTDVVNKYTSKLSQLTLAAVWKTDYRDKRRSNKECGTSVGKR